MNSNISDFKTMQSLRHAVIYLLLALSLLTSIDMRAADYNSIETNGSVEVKYKSFGTYFIDDVEYRSTEIKFTAVSHDLVVFFPLSMQLSGEVVTHLYDISPLNFIYEDVDLSAKNMQRMPELNFYMFTYIEKDSTFTANVLYAARYSEEELLSKFTIRKGSPAMKNLETYKCAYPHNSIVLSYPSIAE
ncbi:MAG: hypothetical protein NC418_11320 [Muribaculaceae bacterium]|nr:hypothetical protein [Muribaculaceae bacterium]